MFLAINDTFCLLRTTSQSKELSEKHQRFKHQCPQTLNCQKLTLLEALYDIKNSKKN